MAHRWHRQHEASNVVAQTHAMLLLMTTVSPDGRHISGMPIKIYISTRPLSRLPRKCAHAAMPMMNFIAGAEPAFMPIITRFAPFYAKIQPSVSRHACIICHSANMTTTYGR